MKTVNNITQMYRSHLEPVDHLVLNLEMILAVSGMVFLLLNAVTFRYQGIQFISFHCLLSTPVLLFLILISRFLENVAPKCQLILKSYCLFALAIISVLILLDGVQLTPFPSIDNFLAHADSNLKLNERIIENWTITHPLLRQILKFAYHSVTAQWLLMPLILSFSRQRQKINLYLVASLLAFLFGSGMYYFFPSLGPATLPDGQHPVPASLVEAMVVFPTFHVMLATINIIIWRRACIVYFVPIFLINFTAVFATLLLGWNYGVHIALGVIMAVVAFGLAKRLLSSEQKAYLTAIPAPP
ncbi:MAG: phosphatase PAP2 family protein [Proteobacteria bacterium]|nr:phosphatase PAP2 family protein [Pseudomonadota bacterium]